MLGEQEVKPFAKTNHAGYDANHCVSFLKGTTALSQVEGLNIKDKHASTACHHAQCHFTI